MLVKKTVNVGPRADARADTSDAAEAAITFASAVDAAHYRRLAARQRWLAHQLAVVETDLEALLSRATWSLAAIIDREG